MAFNKVNYVDDQTIITAQNLNDIQNEIVALSNKIYPIGSIYLSVTADSPASMFGGSWERLRKKFLVGCSNDGTGYNNGDEGGNENHTHTSAAHTHTTAGHTLTENELPVLSGHITMHSAENAATGSIFWNPTGVFANSPKHECYVAPTTGLSAAHSISGIAFNAGGGASHSHGNTGSTTPNNTGSSSNMPPYLAVYMWKRIA